MIYALVVGIDKYPIPRHQLNGCVNDAEALVAYLEGNYPCEELDIKTIFDEAATRQNIIDGFQHFKKATASDTCLLYYSGHGSQVTCPPEFRHIDPDGLLETLVCWDSRLEDGRDLIDKELSYLLWEATHQHNPHFTAIFDCCHSGTNLRDVKITARKLRNASSIPRANDFHASEHYQRSVDAASGLVMLRPPRGRYVQLAAARADQTAKELRIGQKTRGAFTYNLISILTQQGGQVTYHQLQQHLEVQVKNYVKEQVPQIDASDPEDASRYFLGQLPQNNNREYTLNFEKESNQWVVNAGTMHNWPEDRADEIVLAAKTPSGRVELKVTKVDMFKSYVADHEKLDKTKSYQLELHFLPSKKVLLWLDESATAQKLGPVLLDAQEYKKPLYLDFTDDPEQAKYWVRFAENSLQLTLPDDDRPVFRRIPGADDDAAQAFIANADDVAHWHHVMSINNGKTKLTAGVDFEIELFRATQPGAWKAPDGDDCEVELVDWKTTNVFNYDYDPSKTGRDRWLAPAMRLKVKNTSQRTLYFSTVYMGSDFLITNKFMPVERLQPGEEAMIGERWRDGRTFKTIPLSIHPSFLSYGVNEVESYFRVFISTQQPSTNDFEQDGLEMDISKALETVRIGRDPADFPVLDDWTAETVALKIVRPTEEAMIGAGQAAEIANAVTVTMPSGVSGAARLNSKSEASRNLGSGTDKPFPSGWDSHALDRGLSNKPAVNVLELREMEGTENITADNPIKLQLKAQANEDEMIIPVGYDEETGLYYPIGIMQDDGMIAIDTLPDPTPTGERSLTGSIKIFFQKAVSKFLPFVYDHPQLALATFEEVPPEEKQSMNKKIVYNSEVEAVKSAVAEANTVVLFIHGIIGDTLEMPKSIFAVKDESGKALDDCIDVLLTFDYENLDTDIRETAQLLKDRLAAVGLTAGHGKKFEIIAHSMGGLVSRYFIEKLGGNEIVNRLNMLGTPNQGSPYGSLYEMATPLLANAVNGAAFVQPYLIPLRYVGKFLDKMFSTLKQMNSDSDFLKELNDGTDPGIPYTIIAGNTNLIPGAKTQPMDSLLKKVMARFKGRAHYEALTLLLFKQPNDIAVSTKFIEEIPGAEQWAAPPETVQSACDHISYFGNPAGLAEMRNLIMSRLCE